MNAETFAETIEAYIAARIAEGCAKSTVAHARRPIAAFHEFLSRHSVETVGEIDQAMIQAYLAERYSLALERAHVTGGATVILAMGAGRQAAAAMHEFLTTGEW